MYQTNDDMITEATEKRALAKKKMLAEAIVALDEQVANESYKHGIRESKAMTRRAELVEAMDKDLPMEAVERMVGIL